MAASNRSIPPLLHPFLCPPPGKDSKELVLITSVLGTSANWLVLRYLVSYLQPTTLTAAASDPDPSSPAADDSKTVVVMVSFLRDAQFWVSSAGKLGLDLAAAGRKGNFVCIDGTDVFLPSSGFAADAGNKSAATAQESMYQGKQPQHQQNQREWHRKILLPKKERISSAPSSPPPSRTAGDNIESQINSVLRSLHPVSDQGNGGRNAEQETNIILILDGLDFYLAAAGSDYVSSSSFKYNTREDSNLSSASQALLTSLTTSFRPTTDAVILTCHADDPLIHPPSFLSPTTTLEQEHAAFVLSLAHAADVVIGCRMLDTGSASDVSGVLRITPGGGKLLDDRFGQEAVEGHEYLYYISSDGGVRVFERGSSD